VLDGDEGFFSKNNTKEFFGRRIKNGKTTIDTCGRVFLVSGGSF
jgi:hypothetical protein